MASPNAPHTTKTTLRWLAYGLVGLLAFGAMAPLASAQEDEIPAPPADHTEKDKGWKCKWLRLCHSPKHFPEGEFNESSGFVSGRYVEFTYDNETGTLVDVYVKFHRGNHTAAVKFFDDVAMTPFNAANATLNVSGSKVTVKTDGAMYVAHDVRRSLIGGAARGGNYTLVYDLAEGCEEKLTRRGVVVECDGITGLIVPRGRGTDLSVGNGTVTVDIEQRGAGAFTLVPPKSMRVKAWMREHGDELRDRAKDEAREHADEARDLAKDRIREEFRDRLERHRQRGGDDGSANNTTEDG